MTRIIKPVMWGDRDRDWDRDRWGDRDRKDRDCDRDRDWDRDRCGDWCW
jgi:hypothetical protein